MSQAERNIIQGEILALIKKRTHAMNELGNAESTAARATAEIASFQSMIETLCNLRDSK